MSDHHVVVIPETLGALPDEVAERRARAVLERVATLSEIETRRSAGLVFVDCGQSFESVTCPACGTDAMSWWGEAMDRAWSGDSFGDLTCVAPCCGARASLHDLVYGGAQGFARFELRARNDDGRLAPATVTALENALGMRVRVIYAHY